MIDRQHNSMRGADMMPPTKQPWLPDQCDLLEHLLAAGCAYNKISERVGHTIFSCRTKASELRAMRRRAEPEKYPKVVKRKSPAKSKPVFIQAPAGPMPLRAASTSKLILDAELRSRISEQGITAGLLGDPRPGRSMLDRRKEMISNSNPGAGGPLSAPDVAGAPQSSRHEPAPKGCPGGAGSLSFAEITR